MKYIFFHSSWNLQLLKNSFDLHLSIRIFVLSFNCSRLCSLALNQKEYLMFFLACWIYISTEIISISVNLVSNIFFYHQKFMINMWTIKIIFDPHPRLKSFTMITKCKFLKLNELQTNNWFSIQQSCIIFNWHLNYKMPQFRYLRLKFC